MAHLSITYCHRRRRRALDVLELDADAVHGADEGDLSLAGVPVGAADAHADRTRATSTSSLP